MPERSVGPDVLPNVGVKLLTQKLNLLCVLSQLIQIVLPLVIIHVLNTRSVFVKVKFTRVDQDILLVDRRWEAVVLPSPTRSELLQVFIECWGVDCLF